MKTLSYNHRIALIAAISVVLIFGVLCLAPIPQDLAYHDFADKRAWLGIPNFGDVAGNLPFIIVGILGLLAVQAKKNALAEGYGLWMTFFGGVFLTGFGSGYYHLAPENSTLVWDRLPMTISFMSLFSLIIMERVHLQAGRALFPVLLAVGVGAVWYWDYTEGQGLGDLRPYALVQFLPMIIMPLILILFPAKHGGTKYLLYTLGWYVMAKLLEHFDKAFFDLAGGLVSGHTLKHVAAAVGVACMIGYMESLCGRKDAKT